MLILCNKVMLQFHLSNGCYFFKIFLSTNKMIISIFSTFSNLDGNFATSKFHFPSKVSQRAKVRASTWESFMVKKCKCPQLAHILEHVPILHPNHRPVCTNDYYLLVSKKLKITEKSWFKSGHFKIALNNYQVPKYKLSFTQHQNVYQLTSGYSSSPTKRGFRNLMPIHESRTNLRALRILKKRSGEHSHI